MSHVYKLDPLPDALERLRRFYSVENTGGYGLGKGGRNPAAPSPLFKNYTDCSGLYAWLNGYDRFQPCKKEEAPAGYWDDKNGGFWLETTRIVADATRRRPRWFRALKRTEPVRPGDGVVFGDPENGDGEGHVGMVLQVLSKFEEYRRKRAGWGPHLIIGDCSPRRPKYRLHAIQIRPDGAVYFERSGRAYFIRPVGE